MSVNLLLYLSLIVLVKVAHPISATTDFQCDHPMEKCMEMVQLILNATVNVQKCEFTCLAAGQTFQMYHSASVVFNYIGGNNTEVTNQFEIGCNQSLTWVPVMYSLRNVSSGVLNLTKRENCLSCNSTANNDYACIGK